MLSVCVPGELSLPLHPVSGGAGPFHYYRAGPCHWCHCQEWLTGRSSLSSACAAYLLPLQGAAVDENIAKILDNYSTDNTDRNAINFVQRTVSAHTNLPLSHTTPPLQFECCGWNNASDYVVRDISIPISCDCTDSNTIDICEPFGTNHTIWSLVSGYLFSSSGC